MRSPLVFGIAALAFALAGCKVDATSSTTFHCDAPNMVPLATGGDGGGWTCVSPDQLDVSAKQAAWADFALDAGTADQADQSGRADQIDSVATLIDHLWIQVADAGTDVVSVHGTFHINGNLVPATLDTTVLPADLSAANPNVATPLFTQTVDLPATAKVRVRVEGVVVGSSTPMSACEIALQVGTGAPAKEQFTTNLFYPSPLFFERTVPASGNQVQVTLKPVTDLDGGVPGNCMASQGMSFTLEELD